MTTLFPTLSVVIVYSYFTYIYIEKPGQEALGKVKRRDKLRQAVNYPTRFVYAILPVLYSSAFLSAFTDIFGSELNTESNESIDGKESNQMDAYFLKHPNRGIIYGPVGKIPEAAASVRWVLFPIVVLSGFWMWKGHASKGGSRGLRQPNTGKQYATLIEFLRKFINTSRRSKFFIPPLLAFSDLVAPFGDTNGPCFGINNGWDCRIVFFPYHSLSHRLILF